MIERTIHERQKHEWKKHEDILEFLMQMTQRGNPLGTFLTFSDPKRHKRQDKGIGIHIILFHSSSNHSVKLYEDIIVCKTNFFIEFFDYNLFNNNNDLSLFSKIGLKLFVTPERNSLIILAYKTLTGSQSSQTIVKSDFWLHFAPLLTGK